MLAFSVHRAVGDNKKHTTAVTVLYKSGKPYKGAKVVLGFFTGSTDNYYTDNDGVALVKHASTGTAKVYVDGDHSSHGTTLNAPGKVTVRLKK